VAIQEDDNMEYKFNLYQLQILNRLVFDASFDLRLPEVIIQKNNFLQLELERRTFENVTRTKTCFITKTKLSGQTSTIRFENVSDIYIDRKTEIIANDFLDKILIDTKGKLSIISRTSPVKITMNVTEKTIIYLKDIRESNFGSGIVYGKSGFTKDEWIVFLKENDYTGL
jgi:hypothetical protein